MSKVHRVKITDLDKFAEQQIYNPYKRMLDDRLTEYALTLENVDYYASEYPEWWKKVAERIWACSFYFPYYIEHDVVKLLQHTNAHKLTNGEK